MATATDTQGLIFVTGGKGKTGRRVAERLLASGRQVRIGSRSGDPAFDWEQPSTWDAALKDADAVYVAYQPDLAVPTALPTVSAFFDTAVRSGVKKIVLLSGRGEPEAQAAEDALRDYDVDWTILRSSWFHQNFSESFFRDAVLSGVVALPVGSIAEPFVDAEDISEIGADAFIDSRHSRQLYELTGPKAITFAEAVAEIARATQQKIDFVAISPEEYRAELVRAQLPQDSVDLVLYLMTTVLDGRNAPVCDGVQRALGRPPRSFADFVRDLAPTGIWGNSLATRK